MIEALEGFNREQREEAARGNPNREWHIGIGVAYGMAIVGNVGCERKMNYTAFGHTAEFAEYLEGATKRYRQQCILSESVQRKVKDQLPCRLLDFVSMGGGGRAMRIYSVKKTVSGVEHEAWDLHNAAMEEYLKRDFAGAANSFERVCGMLGDDAPSGLMLERCRAYAKREPPPRWDGVEIGETA